MTPPVPLPKSSCLKPLAPHTSCLLVRHLLILSLSGQPVSILRNPTQVLLLPGSCLSSLQPVWLEQVSLMHFWRCTTVESPQGLDITSLLHMTSPLQWPHLPYPPGPWRLLRKQSVPEGKARDTFQSSPEPRALEGPPLSAQLQTSHSPHLGSTGNGTESVFVILCC